MNTILNTLYTDTQYHLSSPLSLDDDSLAKNDSQEVKKFKLSFDGYSWENLFVFWNTSHLKQECLSERLLLALARGIYENKNFRDILLLSSLTPVSLKEVRSLFAEISTEEITQNKEELKSQNSSNLIEITLRKIFKDPYFYPNEKLIQNSIWHIYEILTCIEEKDKYIFYRYPLYALLAYIYWWNGEEKSALDACQQVLKENEEYVLARIIFTALKEHIFPAWYHQEENIPMTKNI